jgi:hypothetical protein
MSTDVSAHGHHHEDHSHAGQGAVLLDIGGDVGAVVVRAPAGLVGEEIEICPAGQRHGAAIRPHVAVIARPVAGRRLHSAVFPSVREGRYELYRKPDGPTAVTVAVRGGQVTETSWPGASIIGA